jgi:hypothetical protein
MERWTRNFLLHRRRRCSRLCTRRRSDISPILWLVLLDLERLDSASWQAKLNADVVLFRRGLASQFEVPS